MKTLATILLTIGITLSSTFGVAHAKSYRGAYYNKAGTRLQAAVNRGYAMAEFGPCQFIGKWNSRTGVVTGGSGGTGRTFYIRHISGDKYNVQCTQNGRVGSATVYKK